MGCLTAIYTLLLHFYIFLLEKTFFLRYCSTTSENVDCVNAQPRFRILA